jgi:hypothetical protein
MRRTDRKKRSAQSAKEAGISASTISAREGQVLMPPFGASLAETRGGRARLDPFGRVRAAWRRPSARLKASSSIISRSNSSNARRNAVDGTDMERCTPHLRGALSTQQRYSGVLFIAAHVVLATRRAMQRIHCVMLVICKIEPNRPDIGSGLESHCLA